MIKKTKNVINKKFIILTLIGLFLCNSTVDAAELYLEPLVDSYQSGDVFGVEIKIKVEDECINALKIDIGFNQEVLSAVEFSQGQSIISLWTEIPEIQQEKARIFFSGGIPGGYCGEIPGDPGVSNLLGKIIFRVKEIDQKRIAKVDFLDTSEILLNDGQGTRAELSTEGAIFTFLPKQLGETGKDEWQEELGQDNIVPEPFRIEICQEPSVFKGEYFVVFSTADKQTGLDYFEIKEGDNAWERANSPYLLKDQTLLSRISVKAVDKAGNERIAEYVPEMPKKRFLFLTITFVIIIGAFIIWWVIRKTRKRNEKR